MEENFKKALLEATEWTSQLSKYERENISVSEAKKIVIQRIFDKYKKQPKCNHEPIEPNKKYTGCKKCGMLLQMKK